MLDIAAIIFDLDGTLLDTLKDTADAVNRVLRQQRLPEHPIMAFRFFVGDGAEMLIRRALPAAERNEVTIGTCLEAFLKDYGENWDKHTKPYDGIPDVLDAVSLIGLPMAIFSNKPQVFTENCVKRFLADWRFIKVIGAGDQFPKKPDPTGALAIAESMKQYPSRILFLGDSAIDMKTALAAQMLPVGAGWGFRPESELLENGCRYLARHPLELLDLIEGRRAWQQSK